MILCYDVASGDIHLIHTMGKKNNPLYYNLIFMRPEQMLSPKLNEIIFYLYLSRQIQEERGVNTQSHTHTLSTANKQCCVICFVHMTILNPLNRIQHEICSYMSAIRASTLADPYPSHKKRVNEKPLLGLQVRAPHTTNVIG